MSQPEGPTEPTEPPAMKPPLAKFNMSVALVKLNAPIEFTELNVSDPLIVPPEASRTL